jgi:hypothetical protein
MTEPVDVTHDITLATMGPIEHRMCVQEEKVYLTFEAKWRGRPVRIEMLVRRYWSSSGMTPYYVSPHEAREAATEGRWRGDELTPTARGRLGEQFKDVAMAWVDTDAYKASEGTATRHAIERIAREMRPYGEDPARDLKLAIKRNLCKLSPEDKQRLRQVASLFNAFAARLDNKPIPEA